MTRSFRLKILPRTLHAYWTACEENHDFGSVRSWRHKSARVHGFRDSPHKDNAKKNDFAWYMSFYTYLYNLKAVDKNILLIHLI